MNKLLPILFVFLLSMSCTTAQVPQKSENYGYNFLHPELNKIQYNNINAFSKFLENWNDSTPHHITIAHCGDSHVQPDAYTGSLRRSLQAEKGKGGRGMLFPYKIAKTYSAVDYNSSYTGVWQTSNSIRPVHKLELGVSGFTALTDDEDASFTIDFKEPLDTTYRIIKIFYKKSFDSFDFTLEVDGKGIVVPFENGQTMKQPYIAVRVPAITKTIRVGVERNGMEQEEFHFYGLSIEADNRDGVIVHNLGIGGAMYEAVLLQELFDDQFPSLRADMIILDFGTNNYLYKDLIPMNMDSIIVETIRKVRRLDPDISIMLTSTQDMYYKRHLRSGEIYSDLVKKIAFENDCLFYDWFWVSGGNYSMKIWQKENLGRRDGVHLTVKGSTLKGEMLADAIKNTVSEINAGEYNSVISNAEYNRILGITEEISADSTSVEVIEPIKSYHKVLKGETLAFIAKKYGVSLTKLKRDNNIKGNAVKLGKTLIINK